MSSLPERRNWIKYQNRLLKASKSSQDFEESMGQNLAKAKNPSNKLSPQNHFSVLGLFAKPEEKLWYRVIFWQPCGALERQKSILSSLSNEVILKNSPPSLSWNPGRLHASHRGPGLQVQHNFQPPDLVRKRQGLNLNSGAPRLAVPQAPVRSKWKSPLEENPTIPRLSSRSNREVKSGRTVIFKSSSFNPRADFPNFPKLPWEKLRHVWESRSPTPKLGAVWISYQNLKKWPASTADISKDKCTLFHGKGLVHCYTALIFGEQEEIC